MLEYTSRFGSDKVFFGGPPESSHKVFLKDTGNNTQKRVYCFTSQVGKRYYETMIIEIAKEMLDQKQQQKGTFIQSSQKTHKI